MVGGAQGARSLYTWAVTCVFEILRTTTSAPLWSAAPTQPKSHGGCAVRLGLSRCRCGLAGEGMHTVDSAGRLLILLSAVTTQ